MGRHRRRGCGVLAERAADLKNRGVRDVFFLVCDGLKGLPEVVDDTGNDWPVAGDRARVVHQPTQFAIFENSAFTDTAAGAYSAYALVQEIDKLVAG